MLSQLASSRLLLLAWKILLYVLFRSLRPYPTSPTRAIPPHINQAHWALDVSFQFKDILCCIVYILYLDKLSHHDASAKFLLHFKLIRSWCSRERGLDSICICLAVFLREWGFSSVDYVFSIEVCAEVGNAKPVSLRKHAQYWCSFCLFLLRFALWGISKIEPNSDLQHIVEVSVYIEICEKSRMIRGEIH